MTQGAQTLLYDNLEGWGEVGERVKREGTYVYLWLIHADVWQKPTQCVKQLSFNRKKKKKTKMLGGVGFWGGILSLNFHEDFCMEN